MVRVRCWLTDTLCCLMKKKHTSRRAPAHNTIEFCSHSFVLIPLQLFSLFFAFFPQNFKITGPG